MIGSRLLTLLALSAPLAGALPQTAPLPAIDHAPPSVAYRWSNVVIRGGGFVTGVLFSPTQPGLIYARTDVGGAYRSDDGGKHWHSMSDSISRDDESYMGIESIAVDRGDASRLYMAAGMYSSEWGGPAAIFRSDDQGRSFQRTALPVKMGGNEDGRGCGERLAVDPAHSSVLFFGSRHAGLWKSEDRGVTWSQVNGFPILGSVPGVGAKAGITLVSFSGKSILVGVSQTGASLYRSDDEGSTWRLVDGAPVNLFPCRVAHGKDGEMYFTYNDNVGPNGITDGAVWRYSIADGGWRDMSPVKPGGRGERRFGFGGIAVDAQHTQAILTTTIDRWGPPDTIFRSVDGGESWKDLGVAARSSAPTTPWVYWHRETTGGRGWMNDIEIDPFDSAHVLYTTGEGIWSSNNVTAADQGRATEWAFPDDGFEETVPLSLLSPPAGAHLLSALGDIGGFRHDDLNESPQGGSFTNPTLGTTTSMDFAGLVPLTVVRVGYGNKSKPQGGYSLDGGLKWTPFAKEPPDSRGGGNVVLGADGKTVIWAPDKGLAYWSEDWGRDWQVCVDIPTGAVVISDRVDAARFFSFNVQTGELLESVDGAHTFEVRARPVSATGGRAVLAATPGVSGDIWVAAGKKLYHTSDSAESFTTLDGMSNVNAIGFGSAAQGSKTPALYVDGVVLSESGIFRSDDAGKSWKRIDDPDHRFGWKNIVTGDPRVFGRVYLGTGGRGIVLGEPMGADKQ